MTAFLFRFIKFSVFFSVTTIGLYFLTGILVSRTGRFGTAYDKHRLLEASGSPKMVLIGGSNLHYGINSKLLEDSLQIPVINMALQGSVGLKYMFKEVENSISSGDRVLIALEYGHFVDLDINGESALCRLVSVYPQGFGYLDFKQLLKFPRVMGIAIAGNFQEIVGYFINRYRGYADYRYRSNKWGDYIWHKGKESVYAPPHDNAYSDIVVSDEAIDLISEFSRFIDSRDASLLITFPPIASSLADTLLYHEIEKRIRMKGNIISNYNDYIFPDSFFFDTEYHLLYEKRDTRSQILLNDIRQFYQTNEKYAFRD